VRDQGKEDGFVLLPSGCTLGTELIMATIKPHFGALKKEKLFLTVHQTMPRGDAVFYGGYDPLFLAKKATALFGIYKNVDAFWKTSESWA
jgi:hypothetical protein